MSDELFEIIGDAIQDDDLLEDIKDCIGKELSPRVLKRLWNMLSEEVKSELRSCGVDYGDRYVK